MEKSESRSRIKSLKWNREEVKFLLNGNISDHFTLGNVARFVNQLNYKEIIFFKVLIYYKNTHRYSTIRISKREYSDYLSDSKNNRPLNMPISVATILVYFDVVLPMEDEDYIAIWSLLNKLRGKCDFIKFPEQEA